MCSLWYVDTITDIIPNIEDYLLHLKDKLTALPLGLSEELREG